MQELKTIKDLTVTELKAIGYDEIVKLEQTQSNLKIINQELQLRNQPPVEEKEGVVADNTEENKDGETNI